MELKINLKEYQYPIYIKQGILNNINQYLKPIIKGKNIVIISDDNVYPLYGSIIEEQLKQDYHLYPIIVKHGEQSKSFETLLPLYQKLISYQISRKDIIIALGGGVIGDLAGFIAATYLRGIDYIQIPTSLLAQVDSSVGGKVGIDLEEGKNLVGAFKHPRLVLIDPKTLETLDSRYINDGMGEVIKYACLFDQKLFDQLNTYHDFNELYLDIDTIIYQCIYYKKQCVEEDVYDLGKRMLLNFGHTLGHALEQYYQYQHYTHGEAVSIGMVQICKIAELKGLCHKGTSEDIKNLCLKYHLPVKAHLSVEHLIKTIAVDKKNFNDQLSYILIKDIGEAYIYKNNLSFIKEIEEL